jgi:hypothetical protein
VFGALLFLGALGWVGYTSLMPSAAASCPAVRASGPADQIRILDIGAAELSLRGNVCLLVDNVVSDERLREKQAMATAAKLEFDQAEQAFAAFQVPVAAPPPTRFYSRRFRRYVTVPGATPAPREGREAAKARRDVAKARLATVNADLASFTAPRKLALFLDGERSPAEPRTVLGQSRPQTVSFSLMPDARASAEASGYWRDLLGRRSEGGLVPVTVGVAEEGAMLPAATLRATPTRNGGTSKPLGFRVYHPPILWLGGIGLALLMIGLIGLARTTALLRDGHSRYTSYSLARVQMAWWFGLTIAGFVYIWLVTGQYLDVMGSATFVLLGISGATAGAARMVSAPRPGADQMSRGFFADIAGGDRIELHRLQMIAWTIVLGAIYIYNILANFTLTQFDANLLALAGVVNGVYVGLKTQEAG